ncbi:MAG: hypothetical protein IJ371_03220 [Clostridia bacterium]|nr:hypothetical protein [Clostridia bacterium]
MKKFITFTLCLLLCVVTLGLSGCGKSKSETVDTSIASVGNGGMVVTRGEYVYFVNGYKAYTTFTKKNLDTSFNVGGLYRAKLNSNGELDYTENGSLSNAEKLSGNLVGFESTSLFVFGNHIYYSTPITEVNKKGNLQTSKIEFKRVSISGGKNERIYQSKVDASDVDYEFYYADGKVYLMINENGTLKRVTCTGKFAINKVATDVTSVVLPRDTDDVFESDSYKNIYYTKTNDDGKIEIYNYNIASGRKEYKKTTNYKTCELLDYEFGHLYFKASETEYPNYTYFYRVDATKNAITSLSVEKLTSDKDYTDLYLLENETDGYIAQSEDYTYYISYSAGTESTPKLVDKSKLEIIAIRNGYIYFKSSNDIKRINIHNLKTSGDTTQETVLTVKDIQIYDYDIDDNNLYVYATQGDNTYLYTINVGNVIEGEEFEQKLLGVYNTSDAPQVEE